MRTNNFVFVGASALCLLVLNGCATPPAIEKNLSLSTNNANFGASEVAIQLDCGECEVPIDVIEAIREGYAKAREAAPNTAASLSKPTITIRSYYDRGFLLSAAIGPLNFFVSDHIRGTVTVGDRSIDIADSSRIRPPFKVWQMRSLGRSLGEQAYLAQKN